MSHRGNRSFLVARLVKCGLFFIRPGGRSHAADQIIKIITSMQIPIVACHSDRSRDFSRVQSYCARNNIAYFPSHAGRDEYKGLQESAVSTAKMVMEWFLTNWDHDDARGWWDLAALAAEHILNTRASPSRYLIPFQVAHNTRPRYDLFPLSVVSLIRKSKRMQDERTEEVVFLCQTDAQSALVWRFIERPIQIESVHISSIRSKKFNYYNIDGYLRPITPLLALSQTARAITPRERRTMEWREAIKAHADKLVKLRFATALSSEAPPDVVRSFFVGRNIDGKLNARLVANGGLAIEGQMLDQYLPTISERFAFLCLLAQRLSEGFIAWSGDISGAYYATKGKGFIKLPHDWPVGIGGFHPNEIVELLCAIPGDR